jgi:hypothetical protein
MFHDAAILVFMTGIDDEMETDGDSVSRAELINYKALNLIASCFVFTQELDAGLASFEIVTLLESQVRFRGEKHVIRALAERAAEDGHLVVVPHRPENDALRLTPDEIRQLEEALDAEPEIVPQLQGFIRSVKHWTPPRMESYLQNPDCTPSQRAVIEEEMRARQEAGQ